MTGCGCVEACGKVILLGEHAVVYGRAALAAGLSGGLRVETRDAANGCLALSVEAWELELDETDATAPGELLRLLRDALGLSGGARLAVDTWLPPGAGLGSSAALSVGLVRALSRLAGLDLSLVETNRLALRAERIFHGQPSGLDNTMATYGGLCLFNADGEAEIPAFEPLAGERLGVQRCARALRLAIGSSGVRRSTREAVEGVRELGRRDPLTFERILDRIHALSLEGAGAAVKGDHRALGSAMNCNQESLRRLDVSHPALEELIEEALSGGALGAKLTGAGLGGCAVALLPAAGDEVLARWRHAGFDGWVLEAGW